MGLSNAGNCACVMIAAGLCANFPLCPLIVQKVANVEAVKL